MLYRHISKIIFTCNSFCKLWGRTSEGEGTCIYMFVSTFPHIARWKWLGAWYMNTLWSWTHVFLLIHKVCSGIPDLGRSPIALLLFVMSKACNTMSGDLLGPEVWPYLYYTLLYNIILYYTVLYCTILYYTILYDTILSYIIIHILYCTILYYSLLHSTIP